MLGKVKRFNPVKGYGFITGDDKKDYFFHYSELQMDGYKNVKVATEVRFEAETGDRGLVAKKIEIA